MKDKDKTKEQLISELEEIRQRNAELEQMVTPNKSVEQAEDEAREYAESIINTVREPLIALDQDLRVVSVSRSFYEVFKVKPEETVGQLVYDLGNKQWDIPKLRELLETILPQKTTFDNYEVEHEFAAIGRRIMLLNARQIQGVLGKERIILLAIEDITELKRAEEELQKHQEHLEELVEERSAKLRISNEQLGQEIVERKQAEEHIRRISSVLSALRNVNQLITHEKDSERLIQQACDLLVENHSYDAACILLADADGTFVSAAISGLEDKGSLIIGQMKQGRYPQCVQETLIQGKSLVAYEDVSHHEGCIVNTLFSGRSCVAHRLEHEGKVYGAIWMTALPEVLMDKEEQSLFLELVTDISYALAGIEMENMRTQAEERTRQAKERLQLQIDRMPIALITWDTEFRVQTWNPSAEKIFGFTVEETLGKHPYDLIVSKEAQPLVDDIWRRLLEGDMTAHSTNENITKDGRIIICEWANTPLRKADGTIEGILSMIQDITEHIRAEEALRESEEHYRDLFDNANDLIQSVAPDGHLLYVNKKWREALGYSEEEVAKLTLWDVIHPDSLPHCRGAFQRVMSGEAVSKIEAVFVAKDGRLVNVEGTSSCRFEDGKPVATRGIFRDVTERKQAEKVLQKSEERYRDLFDNANDLIQSVAIDGHFLYVNQAWQNVLGYSEEEIPNLKMWDIIHPDSLPHCRGAFQKVMSGEAVSNIEAVFVAKDGSLISIEGNAHCLFEDGKPVATQGIFRDITERKRTQEELTKLYDELKSLNLELEEKVEERTKQFEEAAQAAEVANKAKSGFLASMSHELRTPLNAIIGFSQVLQEQYFGKLNRKQAEYITDILESGKHLLSLINDILDLSKIEAGKLELELSKVKIKDLLEDSLIMIKEKALVHGIKLDFHTSGDLEDLEITADTRRIKQVMFNLLSNAAKFTPDGGVIKVEGKKDDKEVIISVSDTGIGIAPEEHGKIFGEFYQARNTPVDKTPGTGLGLPVTKSIVEMHGGRIWVESEGEGKGSRFTFTLPI